MNGELFRSTGSEVRSARGGILSCYGFVGLSFLHFVIFSFFLVVACARRDGAEVAGRVARQYYERLLGGDYAAFVDGTWHGQDGIADGYRQELIDNARMFVGRQQREHRGIREVRVASAVMASEDGALASGAGRQASGAGGQASGAGRQDGAQAVEANVFLVFCYGDSTTEEVLVPMVEHGGTWYLR